MKLLLLVSILTAYLCVTLSEQPAVRLSGDLILGGLFPVHAEKESKTVDQERGIHRLEAMLFAVDEINKNPKILPNLTLGVEIRDSFSDDATALEESLEFMFESRDVMMERTFCKSKGKTLLGVVGAASSSVSIQVATFLRLFNVSQISYASTSPTLSDKSRYEYFLRTVPPDTYQAKALVDIVKHFKWTSVLTINSEGSYGEMGMKLFLQLASVEKICIVSSKEVTETTTPKEYEDIIREFSSYNSTQVVVLFTRNHHTTELLSAVQRVHKGFYFTWVASDSWGTRSQHVIDHAAIADGAITVTLKLTAVTGFEDYFRRLVPQENSRNPWFEKYWKEMGCGQSSNETGCKRISKLSHFDDKVPFVIDSVYSFAHAVDKLYQNRCPAPGGLCQNMLPLPREEFHQLLKNTSFLGETGTIEFDKEGNSAGRYNIMRFDGKYKQYTNIGTWDIDRKLLIDSKIVPKYPVMSSCGKICQKGQRKSLRENCCWTCESCASTHYLSGNECLKCKLDTRPDENRTGCEPLPRTGLNKPISWFLSSVAFLGIVITGMVVVFFLLHYNHSLVRASGRDLMFLLLLGILLCYVLTTLMLLMPLSTGTCLAHRVLLGLPLSLCYSTVLIKTCRVCRFFNSGVFTTPTTQRMLILVLSLLQGIFSLVSVLQKRPKVTEHSSNMEIVLVCNISKTDILSLGVYNFLLVLLSTHIAFRVRHNAANHNEIRYIGLAMDVTCTAWVILFFAYFSLPGNKIREKMILVIATPLTSATALLSLIFGSKVYHLFAKSDSDLPK